MLHVNKMSAVGFPVVLLASMVMACPIFDPPPPPDPPPAFEYQPSDWYKIVCWNMDGTNKYYRHTGTHWELWPPEYMDPCLYVDHSSDLPTEGYDWEEDVRAKCSAYCEYLNYDPEGQPICLDEGWTSVGPKWNSAEDRYETCTPATYLLDFSPVELKFGSATAGHAADLPCDLSDDCIGYFSQDVRSAMWVSPSLNVRETADNMMETVVGSEVEILGVAEDLIGTSAYTAASCVADACPFYMSQLELVTTAPMTVTVTLPLLGTHVKTLSDIRIVLEGPSLGIWTTQGNSRVLFPPNSLRLVLGATISGATNTFGENGYYEQGFVPNEWVMGSLDLNGDLSLSLDGVDAMGAWSIYSEFTEE